MTNLHSILFHNLFLGRHQVARRGVREREARRVPGRTGTPRPRQRALNAPQFKN